MRHVLVALFALMASPAWGFLSFDGSNFYCPSTPPTGVTCCEKKILDNALLGGTVTQPRTVMECDQNESFYIITSYPREATSGLWSEEAVLGSSTSNAGSICFEIRGVVVPRRQNPGIRIDDTFSSDYDGYGAMIGSGGTAYGEGPVISDGVTWKVWNPINNAWCTATSCKNGSFVLQVTRPSSGTICNDTKTGKAYVTSINLYPQ